MSQDWITQIQPRLEQVRYHISMAAERSGRSAEAIQIIAIAKGQPVSAIQAAVALGLDQIGENRVEEALKKQEVLEGSEITWHMVGHIQSRKATAIVGNFSWVHSIDRMKIAARISHFAMERSVQLPVLLECNVSGEGTKSGWQMADRASWSEVLPDLSEVIRLPGLNVMGLMTMAPWVQDEFILRSTFQTLRQLRDYLEQVLDHSLPELSMGMTDDYLLAIEEGATMVRLGRVLFGART
jgi:pyridoxal phosphate enzyme (YggS family)